MDRNGTPNFAEAVERWDQQDRESLLDLARDLTPPFLLVAAAIGAALWLYLANT